MRRARLVGDDELGAVSRAQLRHDSVDVRLRGQWGGTGAMRALAAFGDSSASPPATIRIASSRSAGSTPLPGQARLNRHPHQRPCRGIRWTAAGTNAQLYEAQQQNARPGRPTLVTGGHPQLGQLARQRLDRVAAARTLPVTGVDAPCRSGEPARSSSPAPDVCADEMTRPDVFGSQRVYKVRYADVPSDVNVGRHCEAAGCPV
jgi:hypothetical protein